jgi:hypothetical protein
MPLNQTSFGQRESPALGRKPGASNRASQQNRQHYQEMKYKDLIEYLAEYILAKLDDHDSARFSDSLPRLKSD